MLSGMAHESRSLLCLVLGVSGLSVWEGSEVLCRRKNAESDPAWEQGGVGKTDRGQSSMGWTQIVRESVWEDITLVKRFILAKLASQSQEWVTMGDVWLAGRRRATNLDG